MSKPKLDLYIDGSYRAKHNKGACAVLAVTNDNDNILKNVIFEEVVEGTTNNIMEMSALLNAMKAIRAHNLDFYYDVEIFCDSEYVINGLTKWSHNWQLNGFRSYNGKEIKNKELWIDLIEMSKHVTMKLTWVKGHAGTELHNEVDKIVNNLTKVT